MEMGVAVLCRWGFLWQVDRSDAQGERGKVACDGQEKDAELKYGARTTAAQGDIEVHDAVDFLAVQVTHEVGALLHGSFLVKFSFRSHQYSSEREQSKNRPGESTLRSEYCDLRSEYIGTWRYTAEATSQG